MIFTPFSLVLEPTSIAVIGASSTEGKVGHDILKNLLSQGYKGTIYPINPKHDEILGLHAYKSILEVPQPVDLAVVVIPAQYVPQALQECGEKQIKNVIVISAGFGEVHTEEGRKLEEEISSIAEKHHIHLIGPNCLGLLRPRIHMNASFAKDLPPDGSVALISQSGAMAVALMDTSSKLGIGYSFVASIGNKAVMDESDFLLMAEKDASTKVIGLYLESIKDGTRFAEIALRIAPLKPIVLLKAGVSNAGSKAASSHTGALAGSDAAIEALCTQIGIRRAHTAAEFLDLVRILSTQPSLLSSNIAIITNAGGPGILATDAAEAAGLRLPALTKQTEAELRTHLPAAASTGNPIDVIGDADAKRYKEALDACGDDPSIDGICVVLTPQVMTPCEEIAEAIGEWSRRHSLIPIVTSFMGNDSVEIARDMLRKKNIPCFETPERAIRALAALRPPKIQLHDQPFERSDFRATKAEALLSEGWNPEASTKTNRLLAEETTQELFELYGLEFPAQAVARTKEEAVTIANQIGFPVVAKISSPQILHKTDVGGIQINLQSEEEVEEAFDEIMKNVTTNAKAHVEGPYDIRGILIQKFLPVGDEFIVGAIRDPSFGPLVMVGLGGIYTELFKDTAFRIAPVNNKEAYTMLQNLQAWKLLLGMRGKQPSDIDALANLIVTISHMVTECPQIIELDLNPVLVGVDQIVIADAKVVVH